MTKRAIDADDDELAENPRARSAKLRIARRTDAPPQAIAMADIDVPLTPKPSSTRKGGR
jgi:16S rRNA (cytosine1402-N4)-methyltransferase